MNVSARIDYGNERLYRFGQVGYIVNLIEQNMREQL